MKRKIMCAFVATSMAFTTVISPMPIYGIGGQVQAFAAEEGITVLDSGTMEVRIDNSFPRVIDYTLGDKKFYGQPNPINTIEVNGYSDKSNNNWSAPVSIQVSGVSIKGEGTSATYTIPVNNGNIESTVTIKIAVEGNTLSYDITDITNNGSVEINSIKIPNLSIVSVRNDQEGANFRGSVMAKNVDVNKKGDRSILGSHFTGDNTETKYMYGIISNNELSASLWTNSDAKDSQRVSTASYKVGDVSAFGMGSSEWVYKDKEVATDEINTITQPKPSLKVVITDDRNRDGKINWNDGAIAYRDIMAEVKGSEDVPDQVAQRIVMNFGSMAPNPFLKTLDNVKRTYLATDGLGQKVLLKGYQSEGHDSAHPDYDAVGRRIGGVEDMKTLLDLGQNYGAVFGIHINAVETYPEAKAISDKLLTGSYGWNWIDAGFQMDTKYDWSTGNRLARLEALKDLGMNLNYIYTDAWSNGGHGNSTWSGSRHAEEIKSVGYNVATEWAHPMENDSLWSHWATDLNYGGFDSKGINSEVARFIHNHQKDVWVAEHPNYAGVALNPLLGGYQLEGFEGWQGNKDFKNYIKALFNTNLPTKFLQHFLVNYWEDDSADLDTSREKEIRLVSAETKEDGTPLHNITVKRKGDPGASGLDATRQIVFDGTVILEDNMKVTSTTSGEYLAKGETARDVKYLIPWTWENIQGNENSQNDFESKLYHWNLNGGSSTWDLPQEYQGGVKVYKLTDTGRKEVSISSVLDDKITLNAEAATPYIVVKSGSSHTPQTITYGEKMHVVDPGFTSTNLAAWAPTGGAKIARDAAYNPMVELTQPGDSVHQTITDLVAGQKYTALVYVENKSDTSKAVMEIKNGNETKSVYTEKSMHLNYVKADAHKADYMWTGTAWDYGGSRMQTMQVTFVAKGTTADLTLKEELKEGKESDGLSILFDDIRIVESATDYYPESMQVDVDYPVFYQNFEEVERGIYPFVPNRGQYIEDNRVHLAEKNAPFTQRGWNGNGRFRDYLINDVIEGDWSLKTHAQLSAGQLLYNTIPQNFRFEPGVTYDIEFQYECGSDGQYKFIYGSGEYDPSAQYATKWMENTSSKEGPQTFEVSITGAEDGQTWFGILGQLNGKEEWKGNDLLTEAVASGAYDLVMDTLKITKTDKPPVGYEPDDPYKEVATIASITATNRDGSVIEDENPASEGGKGGPITFGFDRNKNTYWHSKWSSGYSVEYPVEVVIDLGENKNINKFEYLPRSDKAIANGTILNADFSYKKDGDANYTKIARNMQWANGVAAKEVTGLSGGIKARYLKLTVNDAFSDDGSDPQRKFVSAAEFLPYIMQAEPDEPEEIDPRVIKIWDIKATNKDGDAVKDEPGKLIANTIDGNKTSIWHSSYDGSTIIGKFPVEVVMDMDEVYDMDKFEYVSRNGVNGLIKEAMLSYSVDGQSWTDLDKKTYEKTYSTTHTLEFPKGTQARYLKFIVYSTYGNGTAEENKYVSAGEFTAYKYVPTKGEVLEDAVEDAKKKLESDKVDDLIKSIGDLSTAIVDYSTKNKSK